MSRASWLELPFPAQLGARCLMLSNSPRHTEAILSAHWVARVRQRYPCPFWDSATYRFPVIFASLADAVQWQSRATCYLRHTITLAIECVQYMQPFARATPTRMRRWHVTRNAPPPLNLGQLACPHHWCIGRQLPAPLAAVVEGAPVCLGAAVLRAEHRAAPACPQTVAVGGRGG